MNKKDIQIEQRVSSVPQSLSYAYFLNQFQSRKSNIKSAYQNLKHNQHLQMSIEQTSLTSSGSETIISDKNEYKSSEQNQQNNGSSSWDQKNIAQTLKYTREPQKQNQPAKMKTIQKVKDSNSQNEQSSRKVTKQQRKLQQQKKIYDFTGENNMVHIQGGLVISQSDKSRKKRNKSQPESEKLQQQDDYNLGNQILCTQHENHIFHNYFILKLCYISEPVSEISTNEKMNTFQNILNRSLKTQQQLRAHLKQQVLNENRQQILKIIEEKINPNSNFSSLLLERDQLQNEQLTQFINKNLKEQSFYTFHVFSADFNHKEVNLNKCGFSHKLLQLLGFQFQQCSLQQCQVLFNQFFSLQSFEKLQLECFSHLNSNIMKYQSKHIQIQINTFDKILITCNAQVQMMNFQYPSHISGLFGHLNERVYFINYEIQTSHMQNICSLRSQHFNKYYQNQSNNEHLESCLVKQSSYIQSSEEFIEKYYSVENSIQKEIEKINQTEDQEEIQSFLFKNQYQQKDFQIRSLLQDNRPFRQIQRKSSLQQKKSFDEELSSESNYTNQQCNIIKISEQTNFLKNQTERNSFSEYSQISSSTLSCSQSQHLQQKNLILQSIETNNQMIENSLSVNSHQQIQSQNSRYNLDLQEMILHSSNKQQTNQDIDSDFDEYEDEGENNIDILILKIQLIKKYQQQMSLLRQNQKFILKQNQIINTKLSQEQQQSMNIEEFNDKCHVFKKNNSILFYNNNVKLLQQNNQISNQNLHQNFSNESNAIIINQ